jgi:hypothetical protein
MSSEMQYLGPRQRIVGDSTVHAHEKGKAKKKEEQEDGRN